MQVYSVSSVSGNGFNKSNSTNFKAILTGNVEWGIDDSLCDEFSGSQPDTVVFHDCYKLEDETPESYAETRKTLPPECFDNADEYSTSIIKSTTRHVLRNLGTLPIKLAEWKSYLANAASKENVAKIETILKNYELDNLIKAK